MSFRTTLPNRRLLLQHQDEVRRAAFAAFYRGLGLDVVLVQDMQDVWCAMRAIRPDAMVLDPDLGYLRVDTTGVFERVAKDSDVPFVVHSQQVSIAQTVHYMQLGAQDVLEGDVSPGRVLRGLWRAAEPKTPVRSSTMSRRELEWEFMWRWQLQHRLNFRQLQRAHPRNLQTSVLEVPYRREEDTKTYREGWRAVQIENRKADQ